MYVSINNEIASAFCIGFAKERDKVHVLTSKDFTGNITWYRGRHVTPGLQFDTIILSKQ